MSVKTKPFADLDDTLNALDADDLCSSIETACAEVKTAETVECIEDYAAALVAAEEALGAALKRVKSLRARATAAKDQ